MSGSPHDPFAQRQARQDEPLQLPLVTRRFGVRTAALDAATKQRLSDARLVLAARGLSPEALRGLPHDLAVQLVPRDGATLDIATRGIALRPLPAPPPCLASTAAAHFELDVSSSGLGVAAHIAIHGAAPELALELWAIAPPRDTPAPMPRSEGPRQLPLVRKKFGVRVALLDDKHLLHHARLVLAARGPLPVETLQRLPASARLGPVEQIAQLVNLALPGIALDPLSEAPVELPPVADAVYFELDRTGELFHALDASAAIALHLPPDEWPEELELELWACRPDRGTRTVGDRP